MSAEDVLAIDGALAAYCQLCDDGDFQRLAEQFTPGGTFSFGDDVASGRAAIVEWFTANHPPRRRGKHVTMNAIVEVLDNRAHVVSDFVHLRVIDGAITPVIAGRYRDAFVRIDGRWFIERRDAETEMVTVPRLMHETDNRRG